MRTTYQKSYWVFFCLISLSSCLGAADFQHGCEAGEMLLQCCEDNTYDSYAERNRGVSFGVAEDIRKAEKEYCGDCLGKALIKSIEETIQSVGLSFSDSLIPVLLKEENFDIDYQDGQGRTALIATLEKISWNDKKVKQKIKIASHLIKNGASLHTQDKKGRTAFTVIVEKIEKYPSNQDVKGFLGWLMKNEHIEPNNQTEKEIGWHVSSSRKYAQNTTPLMYAVGETANERLISHLLYKGADADLQDAQGRTALMLLMRREKPVSVIADMLIKAMKPQALVLCDNEGKNAVDYFLGRRFCEGDEKLAQQLIEKIGYEAFLRKDSSNSSPLHKLLEEKELTALDSSMAQLFINHMTLEEAKEFCQEHYKNEAQANSILPPMKSTKNENAKSSRGRSTSTMTRVRKMGGTLTRRFKSSPAKSRRRKSSFQECSTGQDVVLPLDKNKQPNASQLKERRKILNALQKRANQSTEQVVETPLGIEAML